MQADRLTRIGFLLVLGGLLVQIATSFFFWSPGTFIVSAALGLPLVVVGAAVLWWGVRRAAHAARVARTSTQAVPPSAPAERPNV
jgi:uncharacterized membrane protein